MSLLSEKNKVLAHCLRFQDRYSLLLLLIVLSLPALLTVAREHPLPLGSESYYHLSQRPADEFTKEITKEAGFIPWYWLLSVPGAKVILSPLLGLLSVVLFLAIARQLDLSPRFTFLFLLLLLFSPPFLVAFTTISAYGYLLFLLLTGFFFLVKEKDWLALIPFTLASFLDLFSNLVVLVLVGFYWYRWRRQHYLFTGALVSIAFLNGFVLQAPVFAGPFHAEDFWRDLITDFGGAGMGFFLLLLAIIGLIVIWKQKEFLPLYAFLPVVLIGYFFSTEVILPLTIIAAALATVGLIALFDRSWKRKSLQRLTFLILVLGLLFSFLSYLDRATDQGPSAADQEALTWIRQNLPDQAIVLSSPENGYYIQYFARRTPFLQYHLRETRKAGEAIFSSSYITDLFPLLEKNRLSIIYITPAMRAALPADQGFLFLLKNERFKLLYSQEGREVWLFQ